ncbi:MAG: alpha/beta fold hydrolase [Gammaproteobacteria bacterium]|nr:MAG: alpha/beta fold hydrolase [Gammaproteobacteria bacterium]
MPAERDSQTTRAATKPAPIPLTLRVMRLLFSRLGHVLPGIMGAWAYRLWFHTRRCPESAAGQRAVASAVRETLPVDSIPIAVYSWGSGPVVLFIHGWSGRGSQAAALVKPLTAAGYRLIAVDAPGHGETPGDRTNILECAAVIRAVSATYGPVCGAITHSFGGMVLAYAMNHGVSVDRVACISAPARVEFLVDRFARILSMPAPVVAEFNRRLEQRFDENIWDLVSTDTNARNLTAPALVIHDVDDEGVPWQQGQQIAAAWPGAQFIKTQGLGHSRILRDPATVKTVVDFITTGSAA